MFDFAECFTRSARRVVPRLAEQGLALTFDMEGATLPVEGDVAIAERTLHRLLLGVCAFINAGFLALHGSINGEGRPVVRLTGGGVLASGPMLTSALEGLSLQPFEAREAGYLVARGVCPVSGALLSLQHEPASGFLLEAALPFIATDAPLPRLPSAHGAIVWVCTPAYAAAGVFKDRLERLGWTVVLFELATGVDAALARLVHEQPALLIGLFLTSSAEAEMLRWLDIPVAGAVQRVLGVPLGHLALERQQTALQVHAIPLSPIELARLTAAHEPDFDLATLPAELDLRGGRPVLLVVDDNSVNQAVIGAIAQAMGYAVLQAWNGQDAVRLCVLSAPAAVLMDVEMPVMDGIQATHQIRALQRSGAIGPFPILGASADATPEDETACLAAGMDTFMSKPLLISYLAANLRRLTLDAPPRPVV